MESDCVFVIVIVLEIGQSGVSNRGTDGVCLFSKMAGPAVVPTPPPIRWTPRFFFSRVVKCPGRDADHSRPWTAEVKNTWTYTSPSLRLLGVTGEYTYFSTCRMNWSGDLISSIICFSITTFIHSFIVKL